jgi:hypothetical protein
MINSLTNPTILNVNTLNVSQTSTLNGSTTLFSSLYVSGFTIFNDNSTLLSNLNVSGFTTVNASLNVSGFTTLSNNTTITSRLNVSAFTTLHDTIINGNLSATKPMFNGLLVSYATNSLYPNVPANYMMMKHHTFNARVGANDPNPECGILMTNESSTGTLPWGFYSGVVKHTAIDQASGLRYDIGNCSISNTEYTATGSTTFNPTISVLSNGFVGFGTTTPALRYHFSGNTLLNNNTSINSNLNVSGFAILNHATIKSTLNVSGLTTLNNTSINSNLNVSGTTTLNNVGIGIDNPNTKFEISGIDVLRISDYREFGEPSIEFVKGGSERENRVFGSSYHTDWKIQNNYGQFSFYAKSLDRETPVDGIVAKIANNGSITCSHVSTESVFLGEHVGGYKITIGKSNMGSLTHISNDGSITCQTLTVTGKVDGYVTSRTPIYFTTSRTAVVNGISYSAYDLNLNTYTKAITLDGRRIRQFRMRSWHASADFQNDTAEIALSSQIFMSDFNGLSIKAFSAPYVNYE